MFTPEKVRRWILSGVLGLVFLLVPLAWHFSDGQTRQGFPDGFDAVQAAPASHHVLFENAFVRVLQVTLPPAGQTEPMHHHRWPSMWVDYDTGGRTAHIRYHTPDGKVVDQPSREEPIHAAEWRIRWMKPEPMHAIEVVEEAKPGPGTPPGYLRVEIKCAR